MSLKQIEKKLVKIDKIKEEIASLGELRTGSLSLQWNVCGSKNCQCKNKKNPKKHGPYHQLSYMRYRKHYTEFVKKEDVVSVRKQIENYKLFMKLKDEWIDLSIEISKLRKKNSLK